MTRASSRIQWQVLDFRKYSYNKLFPTRWKWRHNIVEANSFSFSVLVLVLVLGLVNQYGVTGNMDKREERIKGIWKELSPHEVQHIFGSLYKAREVPNLDIITPQIYHRKLRRKSDRKTTRSISSPTSGQFHSLPEQVDTPESEKIIMLSGLGRDFKLRLSLNHNLINWGNNDFVHLFRHENHSEVLSDDIVKRQLGCFYHGSATHAPTPPLLPTAGTPNGQEGLKTGRVAMDLCNGLKGMIIGEAEDPAHHYVIHPVPPRLQGSAMGHPHARSTNGNTHRATASEHFIWRRDNAEDDYNYLLRESLSTSATAAASAPTCAHGPRSVNDNEAVSSRKQRRKRSHGSVEGEERFHYRPLSIAPDSYWLQYRTTASPNNAYHRNSYGNSRGDTTEYSLADSYHDGNQQTALPDPEYWPPKGGVLFPESSPPREDSVFSRNGNSNGKYASGSVTAPFYSTDRSPRVNSRWSSFPNSGNYYYNTSSSTGSSYSATSKNVSPVTRKAWVSTDRKGRGDDTIFDEPYHSSLDADIMAMAHSTISQAKMQATTGKEPTHLTIETAVFVDKDLYKHMQTNFPEDTQGEVTRIVLAMINAVQLLYQDPSLGHRVDFVLKRLEVLSVDPPGLLRPYDIDRFLTNFCKWQKTENPASDTDPLHWDHALILTGLDLYVVHQSGKISNQVVGLAPVAGMCTRSSSCTVNEGRHFESVYVMAHEIGHNLGMRHDGVQADNDCDPTSHIMSPTLGSGKITWSACSKRYLDMFLETPQSKCLLDRATSESRLDHDADGRLPGERFDADRQCVLKYGRGSYHATQQPIEDVCRDLHCRREHYTWTSHPALEGTTCGIEMSCRAGKCVPKTHLSGYGNALGSYEQSVHFNHLSHSGETAAYSAQNPLDGGWGKWSPYTDCSSTCLHPDDGGIDMSSTGISLAARRCDSPRPEHGGMQCSGLDRRYKTCTADKICPQTAPRTTVSQYAHEVCARAATVDTELTGRGFMTNTNDPERACSVWCETGQRTGSRSRGWSFPDGTACKLSSQPTALTHCVAGKCQEFSCDSNSHFILSDEACEIRAAFEDKFKKPWYENAGTGSVRNGKAAWTNWESQSTCKLTCLAPGKGLELVERKCNAGESLCSGLALSVRLCKPDKTTILANGCTRLQTAFEYATRICTKYSEKVTGLSGIGMQLSATKEDADRPCRIGCQDLTLPYRFYMVNGEEGWFPAGTDCSRGEPNKKAYCLGGKCIDFGHDDTPSYRINSKLFGKIESIFHRTKRHANSNHPDVRGTLLDQTSLRDLVEGFSSRKQNFQPATGSSLGLSGVDFSRPVVIPAADAQFHLLNSKPFQEQDGISSENDRDTSNNPVLDVDEFPSRNSLTWQMQPMEGSFYEWRKILSDCSVSCGSGIQEVIVQCISGDTVVPDAMCKSRIRPGISGYATCHKPACTAPQSPLWNWLKTILPRKQNATRGWSESPYSHDTYELFQ